MFAIMRHLFLLYLRKGKGKDWLNNFVTRLLSIALRRALPVSRLSPKLFSPENHQEYE